MGLTNLNIFEMKIILNTILLYFFCFLPSAYLTLECKTMDTFSQGDQDRINSLLEFHTNVKKQENKDTVELEKENQALKDKVRRQEIYLKRKLEKDKALRDRSLPSKPLKTPGRPSRTSKIPTPHSAVRQTSRTSIPESLDMSMDLELDDLLAD